MTTTRVLAAGLACLAGVLFWLLLSDDPLRAAVAALGVVAVAALAWRLSECWTDTTVLVHMLGLLLISSVLIGAVVTSVNATNGAPGNPALWLVIAHRLLCLAAAIMWSQWLARTEAPYHRPLLQR